MEPLALAAWSFPVLLLLIFLRVPIGLSMLALGLVGSWLVYGSAAPLLNQMKAMAYSTFSSHSLSIVPLFLLMGQLAYRTGITDDLYDCISKWLGRLPGIVAVSAVLSKKCSIPPWKISRWISSLAKDLPLAPFV